jgi:hypothetical protein
MEGRERWFSSVASLDRNEKEAPILFSNGSRGGGSVVSVIDAFGCLRSLRARGHLMGSAGYGAAWLKSQSADQIDRMLQNRRRHPFPPSGAISRRCSSPQSGPLPSSQL